MNGTDLPGVIEGMEMLEMDCPEKSPPKVRILRSRVPKIPTNQSSNRRFSLKPKKTSPKNDEEDLESIKGYYMNRASKESIKSTSLETIFEEQESENGDVKIGKRKLKRLIQFSQQPDSPSNNKIKKRKAKIKKFFGNDKKKRLIIQSVLDKLRTPASHEQQINP